MSTSDPSPLPLPSKSSSKPMHQPIHASMLPFLDPQYIRFHNEHIAHLPKTEDSPFHPSQRSGGSLMPGSSELRTVGKTNEFEVGQNRIKVRAWTPKGERNERGWPVFIWFHGGGWVLGNLNTENHFCTAMTDAADCVTLAVDYRLAPEHPWPAAVDDALDVLKWVAGEGASELGIDISHIAVGGSSAGANLSAILCNIAPTLSPPIPLLFQMINVPVLDNTLTSYPINSDAPWLSPARMLWYRNLYLPNASDWSNPLASPLLAPSSMLDKVPRTFIGIAELDILANEAFEYENKLKNLGVEVDKMVCKGSTHSVPNLDGVMNVAKELIRTEGEVLRGVFWGGEK